MLEPETDRIMLEESKTVSLTTDGDSKTLLDLMSLNGRRISDVRIDPLANGKFEVQIQLAEESLPVFETLNQQGDRV
ncbi:hypothetical protein [Gimesia algae]|uniref:Uncharacterized protein n=1 Tax=Gimesia algae TaxID=2527971 RepID=A0A517VMK9_9PLAN|nr:hypothetical protein [Gimesia algae]QDT94254.1 hypothetical protein Pan161_59490 [Gimesia algae]